MLKISSKIKCALFIAALALTPYFSLSADHGGGGHGGGGGGGGMHGGGGMRGGGDFRGGDRHGGDFHGGDRGDWHGRGDWDHHHGDWGHHGDWDNFYGFGYWGWPAGYETYYQNSANCYYYQGPDGNWYYTCDY